MTCCCCSSLTFRRGLPIREGGGSFFIPPPLTPRGVTPHECAPSSTGGNCRFPPFPPMCDRAPRKVRRNPYKDTHYRHPAVRQNLAHQCAFLRPGGLGAFKLPMRCPLFRGIPRVFPPVRSLPVFGRGRRGTSTLGHVTIPNIP